MQELKKLEAMPPMSAESTVSSRNYLDWLLAVPWRKRSKEIRSIEVAERGSERATTTGWRRSRIGFSSFLQYGSW